MTSSLRSFVKAFNSGEDPPHSYLFHGPRGCGKTTTARILAREFDCFQQEVNVGNESGVSAAREILESLNSHPLMSKRENKAIILDEVHMASKGFQNALLKATEEPPPRIFFFLCTTEPKKVIAPLKSRTQIYQLELLTSDELMELANRTAEQIGLQVPSKALDNLISAAEGSPRELLVWMNNLVGLSKREIMNYDFKKAEEIPEVIDLCRLLLKKGSWKKVKDIIKGLQKKEDPEKIRLAIVGYNTSVILGSDNPPAQADINLAIFSSEAFYHSGWGKLVACCRQAVT